MPTLKQPEHTDDGSRTFHSTRYQQTYHSSHGALAEATYVFLEASGIQERLAQGDLEGESCRILEVGFGLGLNYLATADQAIIHQVPLIYDAWEHDLLSADQFDALGYDQLLTNPVLSTDLSHALNQQHAAAPSPISPLTLSIPTPVAGKLTIHVEDICESTLHPKGGESQEHTGYDAVYLDAFSPDVNPECWTEAFLQRLSATLRPGGKLATYCAKGAVRRSLIAVGLEVSRLPGPTGKREILVGTAKKSP